MPSGDSPGADRRRLRGDALRNERRLIEVGRLLLRQNPHASAEDIARAAGVGVATLYRRFGTRENLVREMFVELFVTDIAPLLDRAELEPDPREGVRIALEGALRTASRNGIPLPAGMTMELAERFVGPVSRLIRRAQQQGLMRPDLKAEKDTLRILLMLLAVLPTLRPNSEGWKRYVRLVLDSLTSTSAAPLPRSEGVFDPFGSR
jgi:AcrR family transcriptional regulator